VAALLADQYRRWHAADPRLSCPPQLARAAHRVLEADLDLGESWAWLAERAGAAEPVGYLRAWRRRFGPEDSQLMWLPEDHLTCEVFFQFAAAAGADPALVFRTLFDAAVAAAPTPADEPWVVSLLPPAAGLDPALRDLGFRLTSIFAFRPPEAPEPVAAPPGYAIRPAEPADSASITRLYADLCAYHARNDPFADRPPPRLWEDFRYVLRTIFAEPRRWALLVAHPAGRPEALAGFALASVDTEPVSPTTVTQLPQGKTGFIHDFMISEEARGQGLGRALWSALYTALLTRAPERPERGGLRGTWLIYRATNPTGARFWPALGYTPLYTMWRRGGWTS
jgi:GNAT superfamily N-acetyltransferase